MHGQGLDLGGGVGQRVFDRPGFVGGVHRFDGHQAGAGVHRTQALDQAQQAFGGVERRRHAGLGVDLVELQGRADRDGRGSGRQGGGGFGGRRRRGRGVFVRHLHANQSRFFKETHHTLHLFFSSLVSIRNASVQESLSRRRTGPFVGTRREFKARPRPRLPVRRAQGAVKGLVRASVGMASG
ncbi:hypothetical protein FQZ97_820450 [compost metagenome]